MKRFGMMTACLIALCFLCSSVSISAQPTNLPAQVKSTFAFKAKKDKTEKQLRKIEMFVAKIAKEKRISTRAGNLNALLREHVKLLDEAAKQALADGDVANKSQWKKGSIKSFIEFESMAVNHEKRGKAVITGLNKIVA